MTHLTESHRSSNHLSFIVLSVLILFVAVLTSLPSLQVSVWQNLSAVHLLKAWQGRRNPLPLELTPLQGINTPIDSADVGLANLYASNILNKMPQNANGLYMLGLANYLSGNSAVAITDLEDASHFLGDRTQFMYFYLAVIEETQGNLANAISWWQRLDFSHNLAKVAKYNADRGQLKRSIEQYNLALRTAELSSTVSNEQRAEWYYELGRALKSANTFTEAESAYKEAVRLAPNELIYHLELARIHLDTNRPFAVINELKPISVNDNPDYWVTLAEAYSAAKQFDNAEASFLKAIQTESNSKRAWALTALSNFYAGQRRLGEALNAQRQAVDLEPNDPWWRMNLANLYLHDNNTNLAQRELAIALESKDFLSRAAALSILGDLYIYEAEPQKALEAYQQALETMPERETSRLVQIHVKIARVCLQLNNKQAAREAIERALALEPNSAEALQLLGEIH